MRYWPLVTCAALLYPALRAGAGLADDNSTVSAATMPDGVVHVLRSRCVKCHGPAVRKGGLSLATPRGLARGGKSGPVVVAGKAAESPIWERVEADDMPPKAPLTSEEKETLRQWVATGAPGLPKVDPGSPEGADHWSFAPLKKVAVPGPKGRARASRNEVDRFLLERLARVGLTFAPEADRATFIRRLSFDLTGLPPTPEEVASFEADKTPRAYEDLVDRLLASPHYGERWGKYWLDAAGYADSNGYFNADTDRPLAYRYRDLVVRAHNTDVPFDAFVRAQLAGDELSSFVPGPGPVAPVTVDRLVATHFLRNGQDGTGESDGNPDEVRADRYAALEGVVQTIGSALFGLTLQCARCHDHKFEPITQRDYYSLQSVLFPAFPASRDDRWKKPNERVVSAPTDDEKRAWDSTVTRLKAEVHARAWDLTYADPFLPPLRPVAPKSSEKVAFDLANTALQDHLTHPPGRIAWVSDYAPDVLETHVLVRGDYGHAGEKVSPAGLSVLSDPDNPFWVEPTEKMHSTGRRLAFAHWLTRPGSRPAALLARVTVNRVWQYHFGIGLGATPENLGYTGAPPSHPELLEFLAERFVANGWNLKPLHRLIVLSAAYRQTSRCSEGSRSRQMDPDGRLLSRFPLRRLDAEAVRDAMLAVSGSLDRQTGGRYVPSDRRENGEVVVDESHPGAHRRSLYLQQRRTQVVSFLEVFDAPSIVTTCPRRSSATIPLQSLSLLNSAFATARARDFAKVLELEAGTDNDARLERAFLLSTSRPPDPAERLAAHQFLSSQPRRYPELSPADARSRAWADLCQTILASNAFLYVE